MTLEQMLKIMPEGTSKEDAQKQLDIINKEAEALVTESTKGLKENQEKNLGQITKLKKNQLPENFDMKAFETFNEEKGELEKKKKELEDKELEERQQWDALKLKLVDAQTKKIDELTLSKDTEISHLTKALNTELVENASLKEIEAQEGNSFFLMPHMKPNLKTVKNEDNTYSVKVFDKEGNERFGDDGSTPFGVKDLVTEMKANDRFSMAFLDANSGSGNDANAGGGGNNTNVNPWKKDTKNVTQQAAMNRDNPKLAAQMRKAAGVE